MMGRARKGLAWVFFSAQIGMEMLGLARCGGAWRGEGGFSLGQRGAARLGAVGHVADRLGGEGTGKAWEFFSAQSGKARKGEARHGTAWSGSDGRGLGFLSHKEAWKGKDRRGMARHGADWQGSLFSRR